MNDELMFLPFGTFGYFDPGWALPMWRSTDGGQTFEDVSASSLGDGNFLVSVTSLGGRELLGVYCGQTPWTGYIDCVYGADAGTLYSTDSGNTWSHTACVFGALEVLYVGRNDEGDPVVWLHRLVRRLTDLQAGPRMRGASWAPGFR